MPKKKFCVIIPAFNEEKVIEASLMALRKIVKKDRIYVVSDGSKDQTAKLCKHAGVNILSLRKNVGKAQAINKLLKRKKLSSEYHYILFTDADSRLRSDFIKNIKPIIKQKPACIVGNVISDKRGFISAFRAYEYGLSHMIFKNAQNKIHSITVAPGCATLYRSDAMDQLNFLNGTLTEDFDLTLQIHQKKLGEIIYASKAVVSTQDPLTVKDYWQQILRWDTGFWQNVFLHRLYIPNKKINLEIYLMMLDILAIIAVILYLSQYLPLLIRFIIMLIISMITFSIFVLMILGKFWALIYAPLFPLLYFLNLVAYIYGFIRALNRNKSTLSWQKPTRYQILKRRTC